MNKQVEIKRKEPEDIFIASEETGNRIDQVLVSRFPDYSRGYFQRCIKDGVVLINGGKCKPRDPVRENDLISIIWPEEKTVTLSAMEMELNILDEDEHVIVINKPSGLVVHPAKGNWSGTLVHGLLAHDEESFTDLIGEDMRPGIVHRLDKDTSGVMVVAKTEEARQSLLRSFKERTVEKIYLAIVIGETGAKVGTVETLFGRHPTNRYKMSVLQENGKRAVTHYRTIAQASGLSLVEVKLETGRTHQIRVHMSHLHYPIIGDPVYGGRPKGAPFHANRQMLHAWKLCFPHPKDGKMRQYMGTPPDDFLEMLDKAGLPVIGRH